MDEFGKCEIRKNSQLSDSWGSWNYFTAEFIDPPSQKMEKTKGVSQHVYIYIYRERERYIEYILYTSYMYTYIIYVHASHIYTRILYTLVRTYIHCTPACIHTCVPYLILSYLTLRNITSHHTTLHYIRCPSKQQSSAEPSEWGSLLPSGTYINSPLLTLKQRPPPNRSNRSRANQVRIGTCRFSEIGQGMYSKCPEGQIPSSSHMVIGWIIMNHPGIPGKCNIEWLYVAWFYRCNLAWFMCYHDDQSH